MKAVINISYGIWSLSESVYNELNLEWDGYGYLDIKRNDPQLISAIERVGLENAAGKYSKLYIVQVHYGWKIDSCDGYERIFYPDDDYYQYL